MILRCLAVLFGILLLFACWNLEKETLNAFNKISAEIPVAYNFNSDFLQNDNNTYLGVGNDLETNFLTLYSYDQYGCHLISSFTDIRLKANNLLHDANISNVRWILATNEDNSFLSKLNESGSFDIAINFYELLIDELQSIDSVFIEDIIFGNDGSLYATGSITFSNSESRCIVLKCTVMGDREWLQLIGENSVGYDIERFGDDIAVTGFENDMSIVAMLSDSGSVHWKRTLENTESDLRNALITDEEIIYFIGTTSNETNTSSISFKAINSTSDILFEKSFGQELSNLNGYQILENSDGQLILGATKNRNEVDAEVVLLNIEKNGNLNWMTNFSSNPGVVPLKIIQNNDYGYTFFAITGSDDMANFQLIRTDSNGEIR